MLRPISIRCKRWPTIAGARWSEFEGNRHSDLNRTKVIGVLSIQSYTPRAYAQADLNTLQTLADHCGGALERIRAEQALRSEPHQGDWRPVDPELHTQGLCSGRSQYAANAGRRLRGRAGANSSGTGIARKRAAFPRFV